MTMKNDTSLMIKDFLEIVKQYPNDFQLPEITSTLIKSVCVDLFLDAGNFGNEIDYEFIIDFVLNNYELIKEGLK